VSGLQLVQQRYCDLLSSATIFFVPILLISWGIAVYGDWLVIMGFAMIANLSNGGLVQASVSEIILRVSAGERDEANRVFSTRSCAL